MNAEVKEAQAARQADSADPKAGRPRAGSRGPALPSGPRNGTPIGLRKPPSLSTLAMPSFAGARTLSDETLAKIAGLVAQLPSCNRDLLYTVVELIRATAAAVKETKMTMGNLLLVFCPSLNMSPPLLRVLCEGEKIWERPQKKVEEPPVVLDIAAPVLEIVPPAEDADRSSSPAPHPNSGVNESKEDVSADVNPVDALQAIPRPGGLVRHPVSTFYASALEIPTGPTNLERLSSGSNSGQDDESCYVSALDSCNNKTNSATSSLVDSPRIPPLSSPPIPSLPLPLCLRTRHSLRPSPSRDKSRLGNRNNCPLTVLGWLILRRCRFLLLSVAPLSAHRSHSLRPIRLYNNLHL